MSQAPEVKGVWFVTARRHILQQHGEDTLHAVAQTLSAAHRPMLLEPLASAWYAEEVFQEMMKAVMYALADGDEARFSRFIEECTELGVNTFFRILLRITSIGFLMRKMPALSKQYRRNDSICTVEEDAAGATLRWKAFPFLFDRNYRLFTVGTLVKTGELCTGVRPTGEVLEHGRDTMTVRITYG